MSSITFWTLASFAMTDPRYYRDLPYSAAPTYSTRRTSRPTVTETTITQTIRSTQPYNRSLEDRFSLPPLREPRSPLLRLRENRRFRYEDPYARRELIDLDRPDESWTPRGTGQRETLDYHDYARPPRGAAERRAVYDDRPSRRPTSSDTYYLEMGEGRETKTTFHPDGRVTSRCTLRQEDGSIAEEVTLEGYVDNDVISFDTAISNKGGVTQRLPCNIKTHV